MARRTRGSAAPSGETAEVSNSELEAQVAKLQQEVKTLKAQLVKLSKAPAGQDPRVGVVIEKLKQFHKFFKNNLD